MSLRGETLRLRRIGWPGRRLRARTRVQLLLVNYLLLFLVAELLLTTPALFAALCIHLLLLLVLPLAAALSTGRERDLLLALTLPSLLRVLSVALPLARLEEPVRLVVSGLPLLIGVLAVARRLALGARRYGLSLRWRRVPFQLLIGAIGFPLGTLVYLLMRPDPAVAALVLSYEQASFHGVYNQDAAPKRAMQAFEEVASASRVEQPNRLYGLGISLTGIPDKDNRQFELAHAAGATIIRSTLGWRDLEPDAKGQLSPTALQDLDTIVAGAEQRGLKIIFGLARPPCWASADPNKQCASGQYALWYPPADPSDYGAIFRTLVERYGDRVLAWEVWSSPNDPAGWGGTQPDPAAYAALLHAARAAAPTAYLLGGSLSGSDIDYLQRLYAAGALGTFDALSLHPYASDPESCADPRWSFRCGVEAVRATMLANGDDRPIWLTEFSWSSLQVGEASQAAYLQRSYELLASWSFVPVAIWSSVIDSGFTSTRPFIDWAAAIPQVLVFVLFVAVVQELLFRGVLQAAALRALGRAGLVLVSLVFALLHLSLQAPALVPLMFVVGLGFAHLVVRTRSLYGVTLAYAVTYVTAFLVLPSVLRYGGL